MKSLEEVSTGDIRYQLQEDVDYMYVRLSLKPNPNARIQISGAEVLIPLMTL